MKTLLRLSILLCLASSAGAYVKGHSYGVQGSYGDHPPLAWLQLTQVVDAGNSHWLVFEDLRHQTNDDLVGVMTDQTLGKYTSLMELGDCFTSMGSDVVKGVDGFTRTVWLFQPCPKKKKAPR